MKQEEAIVSKAQRIAVILGVILIVIANFTVSALADVTMPYIVSHRGESQDRPENTMAAFRLAFERGVDGVECDVCCTSDGVPVVVVGAGPPRTVVFRSSGRRTEGPL